MLVAGECEVEMVLDGACNGDGDGAGDGDGDGARYGDGDEAGAEDEAGDGAGEAPVDMGVAVTEWDFSDRSMSWDTELPSDAVTFTFTPPSCLLARASGSFTWPFVTRDLGVTFCGSEEPRMSLSGARFALMMA